MLGDFNLNSQEWLSFVFEGKNKEYGAYVNREESSDRHLKAMIIITVIALGLIFLPKLITSVVPIKDQDFGQRIAVEPTIFQTKDVDNVPVNKINVPLPPVQRIKTIIFTPPVVTADANVRDEDLMKTQLALTNSDAAISTVTNENGVPAKQGDVVANPDLGEPAIQKPFVYVEVMPLFPGGDVALMKWLSGNITYPPIAREQGIEGRVSLRFVIKPDGSVDNVEIVKGLDPSCDQEAVRVLKKMPKWIPGRQNGTAVPVYYSLSVSFKLQNN